MTDLMERERATRKDGFPELDEGDMCVAGAVRRVLHHSYGLEMESAWYIAILSVRIMKKDGKLYTGMTCGQIADTAVTCLIEYGRRRSP